MQLTILGSGTGIPLPDRASPSLALVGGNRSMLFDLGPGALRQASLMGLDFRSIDHLFFTHFHPDHTTDLIHFLFATRNPLIVEKRAPFIITGPTGFKDFYGRLNKAFSNWLQLPQDMITIEERDIEKRETVHYDDWTIISEPVLHTPRSLAYRVETPDGINFVYSGDTGFCDAIVDLAHETDVLILECSFPENQEVEGHLTPSLAGKVAALAKTEKLVLLHFYPETLAADLNGPCRKYYNGKIVLGRDGMAIDLPKMPRNQSNSQAVQRGNTSHCINPTRQGLVAVYTDPDI